MKLGIYPTINFKSDYYGFQKAGTNYWLTSIKTDDLPQNGKNLALRIKDYKGKIHGNFPMTYDGKYYTHNFATILYPSEYEILNKAVETGRKEFNALAISKNINIYNRLTSGRSLEDVISRGSTEGIVVTDKNNIPTDQPVILILDQLDNVDGSVHFVSKLNENIKGIIVGNAEINTFSHACSLADKYFDTVSIVYDNQKFEQLKNLAGQKIAISNENGLIEFSKIEKFSPVKSISYQTPKIPILDNEERLLDFSELTRKNSGEKAYRLGVMQKLLKEGYLSEIEIPQGFVIPVGYINKIYEYINESDDELEREQRLIYHPMNAELMEYCKKYDINEHDIIIRSAFNAEDLSDYPTAGIYESHPCFQYKQLIDHINLVVTSKDSLPAKKSRERYRISDNIVQPSIIVQKDVYTDYPFTLYTDTGDGKLRISTKANNMLFDTGKESAMISYDRKSGKIKLEYTPNAFGDYLIKDSGEVVEQKLNEDNICKDWPALLAPLGIVIKNALALEKYFGRPQDIEGGIHKGKVYFWQTRDIIKKRLNTNLVQRCF